MPSKQITIGDVIDSAEQSDRLINVQIQDIEEFVVARSDPRNPLPRHDASLGQAGVVALPFGHLNGAVLQIEEDFDRSHLVRCLVDLVQRFLEVGVEAEHFSVVDQPWRHEWTLVRWIERGQLVRWTVRIRDRHTADAGARCGQQHRSSHADGPVVRQVMIGFAHLRSNNRT